MKLNALLDEIKVKKIIGNLDVDIKGISCDSKTVSDEFLFICLNGNNFDGHKFVRQAKDYGAIAILSEREVETSLIQIIVDDTREAMSIISSNFYGNPSRKMKMIGVTGTNGKTTTVNLIKTVLDKAGINCGVIGTLGAYYNDKKVESSLTTPDPIMLHKILNEMYLGGVKAVVMEVSAHALDLKKVHGITYEIGIFTNLTQDHLDYFSTMEEYKNAKLKLFDKKCKYLISNSDDETGRKIANDYAGVITYGIDNPADVFAMEVKIEDGKTKCLLNIFDAVYEFETSLIGEFNIRNILATMTATALMGVKTDLIVETLSKVKGVSGRLEKVYDKDFSVYIDYAHTPDGLSSVLGAIRKACKGRLICLFGCGGNRDTKKREIMGEISGKLADFTIITSDNPRFEEPMEIISMIEKGVLKHTKNFVIVEDRKKATEYALKIAKLGDIILIAGKGAENYQEILGIKHPYNDKDTVSEILGK